MTELLVALSGPVITMVLLYFDSSLYGGHLLGILDGQVHNHKGIADSYANESKAIARYYADSNSLFSDLFTVSAPTLLYIVVAGPIRWVNTILMLGWIVMVIWVWRLVPQLTKGRSLQEYFDGAPPDPNQRDEIRSILRKTRCRIAGLAIIVQLTSWLLSLGFTSPK